MGLLRKRKGKGSGIGSSGGGGTPLDKPLFQAITVEGGQISTDVIRGAGSATFTRSTLDYVRDFENVYRKVQANEARIQGARRVENLSTQSADFNHADWTKSTATATATTLLATGANATALQTYTGVGDFTLRVKMSRDTGTGNIDLTVDGGSTWTTVTLTGTDKIFSITQAGVTNPQFGIRLVADTDKINATEIQIERAEGASTTVPSEYLATTTAAAYKYYTTTNGSSVASNVLTEASGLALHPTVSKKGANVLARYATRADSTAYVVGDRVITGEAVSGGTDVATNGAMTTDVSWTKGTGWDINSTTATKAHSDGSQSADSDLSQVSTVVGNDYLVTFVVSGYSAGNVTPAIGAEGTDRAADGTFSEVITATSTTFAIRADLNFVGDVDTVTVVSVHNTNDGTAGGNGYVYECVVAGTSAASEGTFSEVINPSEEATNGDFASGVSPFAGAAGASIANVGNQLEVTSTTAWGRADAALGVLTEGATYVIIVDLISATGATGKADIKITNPNGSFSVSGGATVGQNVVFFTGSSSYNTLSIGDYGDAAAVTVADNVSVKEATEDATVGWENKGHYKIAGYLGEPAGTNSILQSRDFDTTWTTGGTPTLTQDQDGIDGVANTAWSILDNDASGNELVQQSVTVPDDSNTHCVSIFILKDTTTSRFVQVGIDLQGGTGQGIHTHVNTQTGEIATASSTGTVTSTTEDHGLWWRLIETVTNNTTGNVSALVRIYPAGGTVLGTSSTAATGTTIFDQAQLELNTSVPSSPIPTTTVAVTRTVDKLSYAASGNLVDTAGTCICSVAASDWDNQATNARIIGSEGAETIHYWDTSPRANSYDGTNATLGATNANFTGQKFMPLSVRWSGSAKQVTALGSSSAEGSYDGGWNTTTLTILSENGSANWLQGTISDVRIYNKDLGTALCESLTSAD